jgi:hypothetical protein
MLAIECCNELASSPKALKTELTTLSNRFLASPYLNLVNLGLRLRFGAYTTPSPCSFQQSWKVTASKRSKRPLSGRTERGRALGITFTITSGTYQFERGRFPCESGGICIGYGDNGKLELLQAFIRAFPAPGPLITVSTAPNGIDHRIVLADLVRRKSESTRSNANAYFAFTECHTEVVESLAKNIEGKK